MLYAKANKERRHKNAKEIVCVFMMIINSNKTITHRPIILDKYILANFLIWEICRSRLASSIAD